MCERRTIFFFFFFKDVWLLQYTKEGTSDGVNSLFGRGEFIDSFKNRGKWHKKQIFFLFVNPFQNSTKKEKKP